MSRVATQSPARRDYQCDAITKWNRAKIIFALGTMLHDFQIAPQSRRISSTTINQHRINMAAQRAPGVCVQ